MRSGFLLIVALVPVLVAGCTAGGGAATPSVVPSVSSPATTAVVPGPSSTPTPTPTPSPSRTGPLTTGPGVLAGEQPPVLDEYAKRHTQAGALAFAAYYFKAFDWSIATTDPYLVQQISTESCQSCARYMSAMRTLMEDGGAQRGGRIRIRAEKIVTGVFRIRSDYVVEVNVDETAAVVVLPSSAPSTVAADASYTSLVFVTWGSQGWQIVDEGAPS